MKTKKKFARRLSVLPAALMILLLTACGNSGAVSANNPSSQIEKQTPTISAETAAPDNTPAKRESRILIVYFSRWGNTVYPDNVDASTSASIVTDGERFGTTEYLGRIIQKTVGGDIHLIETETPYTADFDELREVNHNEMSQNILPKLKESNLDISQYDTVFIGYPVWATDVPQAVLSFLKEYDLSQKTVVPFCTHDGYGAGDSYRTVSEASKAEKTLDGLAVEAKDVPSAKDIVTEWLNSIGVPKQAESTEQAGQTAIKITVGETVLDGVLYDTDLALEIREQLPLTISMTGYGGREYYGGVDFYPENIEGGKKTFDNGDITYCEAHHNMAIFYAQTDNPNLSVEVIPIGKVTSELEVFNSFANREEITFALAE